MGVLVVNRGGRPPEDDDLLYFTIHRLLSEAPSLGIRPAARRAAQELGISVDQPFLWRVPKRYRKLRDQGRLPKREQIPRAVLSVLEARFEDRERMLRDAERELVEAMADAEELGLHVPDDLEELTKLSSRLTTEVNSLALLVSPKPHELQLHALTEGVSDIEGAKEKFVRAQDRHAIATRELRIVDRARDARRIINAVRCSQGMGKTT